MAARNAAERRKAVQHPQGVTGSRRRCADPSRPTLPPAAAPTILLGSVEPIRPVVAAEGCVDNADYQGHSRHAQRLVSHFFAKLFERKETGRKNILARNDVTHYFCRATFR